tara:strand:- start:885 stop:2474 length:1590 start_codon:yes stop_codon:yes gene_type:complete
MADKIVIEAEVKSNIGDVSKDAKNAAGEFKVMGVSLNSVKAAFVSAGKSAKVMFGSIKAGLISTGIGAFLVIVGSLIAYFKSTKRGAEMLERALAGVGAVVSVLTDLMSGVGEVMVKAFTDPQQAVKDLWAGIKKNLMNRVEGIVDSFSFLGETIKSALSFDWDGVKENAAGFGESMIQVATGVDDLTGKMAKGFSDLATEIEKDVTAAMKLKGLTQQLRDEEREFNKVRAQTRQDIQKARLDALDESKTAEERLAALQKANDLELKTTKDVLEMQKRKIEIQKETMALSENMAEDLDELAALEVGLIDLQTSSFQTQKRLATEMETLTNEIRAKEDAEWDAKIKANDEWNKEQQRSRDANLAADKKAAKEKEKLEHDLRNFQQDMAAQGLGVIKDIAGEGTAIGKAAAIAQATISGVQGVQNAFTSANANVALTAATAGAYPIAMATAAGIFSAMNIQKIASGGGAGGGASVPSVPTAPAQTPAPQMMSGAFDITGGVEPEATRAYVVTDEMTNSQNQLANIRRRATI